MGTEKKFKSALDEYINKVYVLIYYWFQELVSVQVYCIQQRRF